MIDNHVQLADLQLLSLPSSNQVIVKEGTATKSKEGADTKMRHSFAETV